MTSCAQKQEIKFDSKIKPNLVYNMTFVTESKTVVDFEGPQEKLEKIKANGIVLPIVSESRSEFITKTTTGSLDKNNAFKAKMEYGEIESTEISNGEEKKSQSPVSGLIIKGQYNENNSFQIDTMISQTLDENLKKTIKTSLEGVQSQIKFPKNPMKVGDDFEQKIPMTIPIAGLPPVEVIITTNYKLIEVKENMADFDIKQTVSLAMESKQFDIDASGGGEGEAEFDIKRMYLIKNETNLDLKLVVNVNDLVVKAMIKTKSKQDVIIEE
jgi:hypothetical protein